MQLPKITFSLVLVYAENRVFVLFYKFDSTGRTLAAACSARVNIVRQVKPSKQVLSLTASWWPVRLSASRKVVDAYHLSLEGS